MCNKLLSKILITACGILFLSLLTPLTDAKEIYKWTDESGNIHFTDNPALVPIDTGVEVEIINELTKKQSGDQIKSNLPTPPPDDAANGNDEDLESGKQEAIRRYWRSRALEIDNREQMLLEEISLTRNLITYKKREVDYLLTNGYFADRSIFELRNLEDRLKKLKLNLGPINAEREKLQQEARRAGVPPGYLRP